MNIDDPKLTAYALGELTGEERQALEKELANDPAARAFVEETAAFATLLKKEFHAETPSAELAPAQRSEVLEQASGGKIVRFTPRRIAWTAGIGALAAALAVAAMGPWSQAPVATPVVAVVTKNKAQEFALPADVSTAISVRDQKNEADKPMDLDHSKQALAMAKEQKPAEPGKDRLVVINGLVAGSPTESALQPAPTGAVAAANAPMPTDTLAAAAAPMAPDASTAAPIAHKIQAAAPAKKSGDGALSSFELKGNNTYTGTTTVNGGTLTLGSGSVVVSSGISSINAGSNIALKESAPGVAGKLEPKSDALAGVLSSIETRAGTFGKMPDAWSQPIRRYGKDRATVINPIKKHGESVWVSEMDPQQPVANSIDTLVYSDGAKLLRQLPLAPSRAESYTPLKENPFQEVAQNPLSTFSIDVDTASYSNVRRFLKSGQRPPPDAVRIEELINYFRYDYPQPKGDAPFSVNVEAAQCPWQPEHRLVRIGLKGREIAEAERPASNLVFLIDISGSMAEPNKLPLLKASMCQLVEKLGENDKVSIVVYASSTGVALPPTRGDQKERILKALDDLQAGGSTNGGDGIRLAYKAATESFIPKGINRVILATDGDFNVGTTSESELVQLIEEERKSGVFLTVLGFGDGNLKDSTMKKLASHGNGNYAYIDSLREGRKVLVRELSGTLLTIAKDVKIQVEFNPQKVAAYRLVGYESRMLAKEDFNNDKKDAGEIGAGHTVTALYEVVPAGAQIPGSVDPLKYQPEKSATPAPAVEGPASKELMTVKLRYKKPTEEKSLLLQQAVTDSDASIAQSSADFRFAAAVAEFGMLLRGSNQGGEASWEQAYKLAAGAEGRDEGGYRAEFLELLEKAKGRE